MSQELSIAKNAAEKAGTVLLSYFGKLKQSDIHNKAAHDFVTTADIEAEKIIIATIHEKFPNASILSEELHPDTKSLEDTWILDGLDGTNNFVTGLPIFGTNIAYYRDGKPLVAAVMIPFFKELYWASESTDGAFCNGVRIFVSKQNELERAGGAITLFAFKSEHTRKIVLPLMSQVGRMRNTGAACYDSILVARGVFDFRVCIPEKPHDVAAPYYIVSKAGGMVSNIDGTPFSLNTNAWISSNGKLHEQLLKLLHT